MTTRWPDPDRKTIDHYLAGPGLRSMKSRTCYRQVLHGFQNVAERHSELGQDVLIAWLRVSAECWAATTLLHRTRIVDPLRANKRETIDRLKFTLEGAGERIDGHALTDTAFVGCRIRRHIARRQT